MNALSPDSTQSECFSRVALLTGRPLYWRIGPEDAVNHAKAVYEMLQWCLDMPGVRLGVLSPNQGEGRNWLEGEEAKVWSERAFQAFKELAPLLESLPSESLLLSQFNQYRCMVFAPFHAASFLTVCKSHFGPSHEAYGAIEKELEPVKLSDHSLCWSLRLLDFSASREDLIYTPLLALWSSWPTGRQWAPPPPDDLVAVTDLALEEASSLLEEVMWIHLETAFSYVRKFYGLGMANPRFADYRANPPVFYFAELVKPPTSVDGYRAEQSDSLRRLVRSCLGSDDPSSEEVSWGVLEGDLVTLRRALISDQTYQPWYLLLPIARKSVTAQELESDLCFIADKLSYLEFTIPNESRDVYTDYEPLAYRQANWGGRWIA